ncbi:MULTISPECIES: hypothetical protein [unclassified Bacillus (in: firmicutes)]|uniref:hypothetical protein n=1 Tax=unclassified Bacillus (in: firmicutes) TaxID=185979 RepID=UPI0008EEDF0D|nr:MULTISPECIES: hypothetical protein [unclassified Bacillus (in: firmicutes)]SFB21821.1 hypothetical protein SAMN02799634_10924 [Bacillus sp. UNCCL13]SFQ91035.1 hypothetical protein SAMN04488577_4004 [Bacillus sp. cl95]
MVRKKKRLEVAFPSCNEFHPSFIEKMINQLDESGSELLGEPLVNCIWGFTIDGVDVVFDEEGNGYTLLSIVDWRSMGKDVGIKWSSPMKKRVSPISNVAELNITFSWCADFPIEELRIKTKKKTVIVDSVSFPFDVEYSGFIESDILIEVALCKKGNDDDKQQIDHTLKQAYKDWNIEAKNISGQLIKSMRYIRKSRNRYIFYFDLGSSGNKAIHFLIQSLATNKNLCISKIFVKQT